MPKWKWSTYQEIAFDGEKSEEYPVTISCVQKDGRQETFSIDEFIKYTNGLEEQAMGVVDSWFGRTPEYDGFVTKITKLADYIGE